MEILNTDIFYYLNSFALQNETRDVFILFFAEYLAWVLVVGMFLLLVTHRHNRREGIKNILVIFSAALAAWSIAHLIKAGYPSPRPFLELADVNLVFEHESPLASFPSGHATFFMALAVALFFYHKKLGVFYIIGAIAIGIARVMAGIHWPGDILAGWFLGGVVGWLAYSMYHILKTKK